MIYAYVVQLGDGSLIKGTNDRMSHLKVSLDTIFDRKNALRGVIATTDGEILRIERLIHEHWPSWYRIGSAHDYYGNDKDVVEYLVSEIDWDSKPLQGPWLKSRECEIEGL